MDRGKEGGRERSNYEGGGGGGSQVSTVGVLRQQTMREMSMWRAECLPNCDERSWRARGEGLEWRRSQDSLALDQSLACVESEYEEWLRMSDCMCCSDSGTAASRSRSSSSSTFSSDDEANSGFHSDECDSSWSAASSSNVMLS